MSAMKQCMALIDSDQLQTADALVLLEGDGYNRVPHAAVLYFKKIAPAIVVSGGIDNQTNGSFPGTLLVKRLEELGVKKTHIIVEDKSQHTREQAELVLKLAKERGWKRIVLIASHYHQYRAFLTFLKVRQENEYTIDIINSPAQDLPWFEETGWGRRVDLLEFEFEKISLHQKNGHVASYEDGVSFFRQKESKQ